MKSKKLSDVIIKTFKGNGFVLLEPDVLLDSDYIIERSGEKFRSSIFTFKSEDSHKFDQIHTIHCVDVDPISRNTEKLVTNFYTDGLKSKYQVPEGKTFFLIDVFFDEYGGYYFIFFGSGQDKNDMPWRFF